MHPSKQPAQNLPSETNHRTSALGRQTNTPTSRNARRRDLHRPTSSARKKHNPGSVNRSKHRRTRADAGSERYAERTAMINKGASSYSRFSVARYRHIAQGFLLKLASRSGSNERGAASPSFRCCLASPPHTTALPAICGRIRATRVRFRKKSDAVESPAIVTQFRGESRPRLTLPGRCVFA